MRRKPLARTPKAPKAPRAERVQFHMTMAAKLLRSIDRIALETGRTRTEMFDHIGRHYLATHPDGKLAK
jgi:metal-responsive CopG/Arc/MetJ family transcriptional regulator